MRRLREGVRVQVLAEGPPYADSRSFRYEKQEVRVMRPRLAPGSDSMAVRDADVCVCVQELLFCYMYSYW